MTKKKRIADWLEKSSVAFIVGSFLADKGFWLPFVFGIILLALSLKLTNKGE